MNEGARQANEAIKLYEERKHRDAVESLLKSIQDTLSRILAKLSVNDRPGQ